MKRILPWIFLFAGFLQPLCAEPGWDPLGVRKTAAELLKNENFAELDRLAADIKQKGFDIRQAYPELKGFYDAFNVPGTEPEAKWLDQKGRLDRWVAASPESLTAKIALTDWYIGYGWKARGTSYADKVTTEGWNLMGERLRQATQLLKSVPETKVDDPEYYRLWVTLESEPGGRNTGSGKMAQQKGAALAKGYYPLYLDRAYFLLPKWFGGPGDWERFLVNAANSFPSSEGDILYARVARNEAHHYGESFFKESKADYARIKRGFLLGAAYHNGGERISDLSNLCYLASIQGDKETAVKLLLDLGDSIRRNAFGTDADFLRLRKECGADDVIAKAASAERAGKLNEAEQLWTSFHPEVGTNPWLGNFYLRQGMEAKLRDLSFSPGKPYSQILDADPATADPDTLAELSKIAPLLGQWEKAAAAAQAFNQKRPFNLIGKNTLWLCALHEGNREKAEAIRKELLDLKTNREAYLAAQAVIKGTQTWNEVRASLKPDDKYLPQGGAAIALHYQSQGDADTAHRVLEEMLPSCQTRPDTTFLESLLYGSVSRSLNPQTPPPSAGNPGR